MAQDKKSNTVIKHEETVIIYFLLYVDIYFIIFII